MEPDKFMIRLTRAKDAYFPLTMDYCEEIFSRLELRLVEVGQWEDATFEIERPEFEKHLEQNPELQNTYIDMYDKADRFFVSEMDIEKRVFEFYLMVHNQRISLVFFRIIPNDQSRFA
jgi:hypothetical protein